MTSRLTLNAGLRYDFYSNPSETHRHLSVIRNPATDSGPTVGNLFAATPLNLLSPRAGFAWDIFGGGKTVLRGGAGIFRDQFPVYLFGTDRFLSPFFSINSFVFPTFLNPQNALVTEPLDLFSMTYHPKFPYSLQYNLNLEREIATGTILSAGYFGARGNHLPREVEGNPFEPALGHRYNPNLPSPLLEVLTDAQSFYNSFQLSVSQRHAHNVSWQAFYTFSHSIDDASSNISIEAVNEPPTSQEPFNRKGDRGRSGFDIRHNFVANVVYELPFGHGSRLGGWQISGTASVHSNVPFTPMLAFDNADLQSLVVPERPDVAGNPYTGICPNGTRVGNPSCWFNPSAFSVPAPGQFGDAGRNSLRGPSFAEFDWALQKTFQLSEGMRITFGVEAYNLFNHPNFAVPSNTQSPLTLGGNGDAVFAGPTGNFADNVGRIFTTVSGGRQLQLDARVISKRPSLRLVVNVKNVVPNRGISVWSSTRRQLIESVFAGRGEVATQMRSLDWSTTALGPVEQWPQALRTALRIVLGSGYPMTICWGPDFALLYNDAIRPVLGTKHPWALGRFGREVYPEAWDFIGQLYEAVLTRGQEASFLADLLVPIIRNNYLEETYFAFSCSPIPDDNGQVGGVLTALLETTDRVLEDRRRHVLRDLASRTVGARNEEEVWHISAETLGQDRLSLPFTFLYEYRPSERQAYLTGVGVETDEVLHPPVIDCHGENLWRLDPALGRDGVVIELGDRASRVTVPNWPVPPKEASILPIRLGEYGEALGFLIVGIHPGRAFDDAYRQFVHRITEQITIGLTSARAYSRNVSVQRR